MALFKGSVGCGVLAWAAYGSGVQFVGLAPTEAGLHLALAAGAAAGVVLGWKVA